MLSGILEPLRGRYDYILIDTCPSLGTLTINALAAANEVIITVNPQLLAMMGMQDFIRTVMKIKRRINPDLGIAGILLTMCESRTKLCKVLTEQVRRNKWLWQSGGGCQYLFAAKKHPAGQLIPGKADGII